MSSNHIPCETSSRGTAAKTIRSVHPPRTGFVKTTIVVVLALLATGIASMTLLKSSREDPLAVTNNAITFEAFKDTFVSSINEVGDIESSSNVEIRCRVKSRGRSGAAILKLIPEGTPVKKGDFICQLDDSLVKDELNEQRIRVAKDNAAVIQAESILESARRKLEEFKGGSFEQERSELLAAITVALEAERRSEETRRYSEALNRKGYVTKSQLEADVFAEEKAKVELKLAKERLRVYEEFTKDRMLAELDADVRKQTADLTASKYTLELSQDREAEWAQQVANSRIIAPADGTLVYANESDRSSSSVVIEEGALIRDGQSIFYLPDPTKMQVKAKVNDSKINKVKVDQRVEIRVDTAPEDVIAGRVKRVSPYPNPRRYYQAPIEYDVYIEITEESPIIRSGLRAKVEVFVEKIADVVQVPISSLLNENGKYYVIVKENAGISVRPVEIGSNNEKFVVVKSGLESGEQVLVDADNYLDAVDIPSKDAVQSSRP